MLGTHSSPCTHSETISYYIVYCPAGTTLDELIHIAGSRRAVEECFRTAKQECGADDYQVCRCRTASTSTTRPKTGQSHT